MKYEMILKELKLR